MFGPKSLSGARLVMIIVSLLFLTITVSGQSVVIYEDANFAGRSKTLPIGDYPLTDFNDLASSIRVPTGLGVIIYEHADNGGGYGISVDLLEDQPDLMRLGLNDRVSYVSVFSTNRPGYFWARNSMQNGQFVAGHWERARAFGGNMINHVAVVSPPLPPHLAPFQLVWDSEDDNGLPLNPKWGWQVTNGTPPSPTQCTNGPFWPPCLYTGATFDFADICGAADIFGKGNALYGVKGHANWSPATYEGRIIWETHSHPCDTWAGLSSLSCDDDYNFNLYTPHVSGALSGPTNNAGLTTARDNIGCEFDSDETIDHFDTKWWNDFHDAVDNSSDVVINDTWFKAQGQLGRYAIVTGLLGLEMVHGGSPELHPVWAMAIRVKDDDPMDEVWAIFIRRWGNEGFCSGEQHYLTDLPNNTYTFRLPWRPGASDVKLGSATKFKANYNFDGTVQGAPNQGVLVSFPAPSGGEGLVNGELHLQWPSGGRPAPIPAEMPYSPPLTCEQDCENTCREYGLRTPGYDKCMYNCKKGCNARSGKPELDEPERVIGALIAAMPSAQREEIARLNPASAVARDAQIGRFGSIVRIPTLPQRPVRPPRLQVTTSAPDSQKRTRSLRLLQTINRIRGSSPLR